MEFMQRRGRENLGGDVFQTTEFECSSLANFQNTNCRGCEVDAGSVFTIFSLALLLHDCHLGREALGPS